MRHIPAPRRHFLMSDFSNDLRRVVDGGYCIGCGVCTALTGSTRRIRLTDHGFYQATGGPGLASTDDEGAACPFGDAGPDETALGAQRFSGEDVRQATSVGRYRELLVGHVAEGEYRARGSSGGITSWLAAELLRTGRVDAVLHVVPNPAPAPGASLYAYGISRSVEELQRGAKSHYYPVEMSGVLAQVRELDLRYAVVGVPCFIKGLRRLALLEPVFERRIHFYIGLFCGHLKGTGFAQLLALHCGVPPEELSGFDFRTKLPDQPASHYGVTARGLRNGKPVEVMRPVRELAGCDWGMAYFKYQACDFCDDISAETADVGVGDAWLPQYANDPRGTNVLVVRHPEIQELLHRAIAEGRLDFHPIELAQVERSQDANLRHRQVDLRYRLAKTEERGRWHPRKRWPADATRITPERARIQDLRMRIVDLLPAAWAAAGRRGDWGSFMEFHVGLKATYDQAYEGLNRRRPVKSGLLRRIRGWSQRLLGR